MACVNLFRPSSSTSPARPSAGTPGAQEAQPHHALRNGVFIDVETTGLDPHAERIIEIGAAHVVHGTIRETFHELINPQRPLSPFITDFTGLTDAAVAQARTSADVLPDFLSFLSDATSAHSTCVFVGHNVEFDLQFLNAELHRHTHGTSSTASDSWNFLPPAASLCTAYLSRALIPREKVGRYKLANVAEYLETPHKPSHRALDDVYATYEVLVALARY